MTDRIARRVSRETSNVFLFMLSANAFTNRAFPISENIHTSILKRVALSFRHQSTTQWTLGYD
jgi:hypothetical protein